MKKRTAFDFNKELVISQLGSMVGGPLLSTILSFSTHNPSTISAGAVIGSMIGGGTTWLVTRLKDRIWDKNYAKKRLLKDIELIIPGDIAASWLLYQPIVFFLSRYLLRHNLPIIEAVLIAQITGFAFYLAFLNLYRGWVAKKYKQDL